MATFLDLTNKAIEEGGSEMNLLSLSTWNSAEAGRRLYPRIKRSVADAWKKIQMEKFEWAFKNTQITTPILPRLKFQDGLRATAPAPGTVFRGMDSGFTFTLGEVKYLEGAWLAGTAQGQLEFSVYDIDTQHPIIGESFEEVSPTPASAVFEYIGGGSYRVTDYGPNLREPLWDSFVLRPEGSGAPFPASYIPWSNWPQNAISWAGTSFLVPSFVSKDFEGHISFLPFTLRPFHASFVVNRGPQILSGPEDVPSLLQEEYHDWIAWEALMNIARFDKNPDLLSFAGGWSQFYRNRANRELLQPMAWGPNLYTVDSPIV